VLPNANADAELRAAKFQVGANGIGGAKMVVQAELNDPGSRDHMNSAATLSGPKRLREAEPLIHFDVARVRSFVIPQHDWISPAPRTPTPTETPTAFSEVVCPKTAAEHASMPSTVATKKVGRV
jgi:hypothetical protein